jgi:type I restriction enzyme R subunit
LNIDKTKLSEQDIETKFIIPALKESGWDILSQIRQQLAIQAGEIVVRGGVSERKKAKRADIVLYYKPNMPLAVIEAKSYKHSASNGMQQALEYASLLDVPFAFASNGDELVFHDKTQGTETTIKLADFPTPTELWQKYCAHKGIDSNSPVITQDYYTDGSGKTPRYYQVNAINKTIAAIDQGQKRILLVMATGTGKTYTAFQIMWRLWKSQQKKRILFLADRNILIDQARINDFQPFSQVMNKIQKRKLDPSYEVYLALYQAITGPEENKKAYKQVTPDFFDLIIIDECHRGSAKEDSEWREILEYFSSATQIGLTATPKETKDVSNIGYFGDPIYTYSLRQGIQDGFLAPYMVIRLGLSVDLTGFKPEPGERDKHGELIADKTYTTKDFDKTMVIDERTQVVAENITQYLQKTDPMAKTIVFCEDIDHASRMRQALINLNSEQVKINDKYIMKITGDDDQGKAQLDYFINPKETYPVIVTTSELLTTGVDAKTCKLIVIDQNIQSMTKFKQVIGRGTRIDENYGKTWFTILDFRGATKKFEDPEFDGPPVQALEIPSSCIQVIGDIEDVLENSKIKYHVDGVNVTTESEQQITYDSDGNPIKDQTLVDYNRDILKKKFANLQEFNNYWQQAATKTEVINELAELGIIWSALEQASTKQLDEYDLILSQIYSQSALTRKERADLVIQNGFVDKFNNEFSKQIITALLDKYIEHGIKELEDPKILRTPPFTELGLPLEIHRQAFSSSKAYRQTIVNLTKLLYTQQN